MEIDIDIDTEKFIDAGLNFIYELDGYPVSCVKNQVSQEFNDILKLNEPDILRKRTEYFGIGEATDYLNRIIETPDGDVIAGIRHLGGNKNKPFVFVWPSFQITSKNVIIDAIQPHFEIFNPIYISYWCRPDCNKSKEQIIQQRFIGHIDEMSKNSTPLQKAVNYYDWYKYEYAKFHKKNPQYINRISINSKETMDRCLAEGLLFFYVKNAQKIGLIAGEKDIFLEKPAIYLNEILINHTDRGKGYANILLASFTSILNAEYFICEIDSDNIPSTKTALRSGQRIFSQEIFIQI